MRSKGQRHMRPIMLIGLAAGLTFIGSPATAAPYLRTSIEMSIARSTKDCKGQAVRALSSLQKKSLQKKRTLQIHKEYRNRGRTKDSTFHVECIFVGPNEQRRNQWIFHVSIASTNKDEMLSLLKSVRGELGKFVRID